jgi:phage tail sheath protein FI
VNALRKRPGYGTVIWGTRTLSTKSNPEWRYVPVRRTAIFIEQSIFNGIQWAVFEPNDHRLWSSLRANIESFMNGLFRAGAFQGEKSGDAYFVRCGLGSTMTQDDIDRGQVIVLIGFAPVKPAEFVIVRIQQKVGQQ